MVNILEGLNKNTTQVNESEQEDRLKNYYSEKFSKVDKNIEFVKSLPVKGLQGSAYLLKDKKSGKEFEYFVGPTGYVSYIKLANAGKDDHYKALSSSYDYAEIAKYVQGMRSLETLTKKYDDVKKSLSKLKKDYEDIKKLNGETILVKGDAQRELFTALDMLFRNINI